MRRRSTRKQSATDLLVTPPLPAAKATPTCQSPEEFEFDLGAFKATTTKPTSSSSLKKKKMNKCAGASASLLMQPTGSSPPAKTLSNLSDLKEMASSHLDSIKRQLQCSHSEILKDIEASHSRLHKRLKIQTQACQQVMDKAEKEYKKVSERIGEGREAMKASYSEFMIDVQSSASRVFKASLPQLSQSFDKAIDSLRSLYGIASTSAN